MLIVFAGVIMTGSSKTQDRSGIVSYAFYKDGSVFPTRYDHTVSTRWGVQLMVASSVISVVTVNRGNFILNFIFYLMYRIGNNLF